MQITFLGTGPSFGVPVVTCDCHVCASPDKRNRRLRAGLLLNWTNLEGEESRILVDTTTDLRQQALRVCLDRVDGVLYTHHHADHVLGLDELRIFGFVHGTSIPLYGRPDTMDAIRHTFEYAFDNNAHGVPRIDLNTIDGPFNLRGVHVVPIPVLHDRITISAYRIGNFAYVTDCSAIPEASAEMLHGVDILVIGALKRNTHPKHFSLDEALFEIERLKAGSAYLTHLSHEFEHEELEKELPENVHVAYDGLVLEADEPLT